MTLRKCFCIIIAGIAVGLCSYYSDCISDSQTWCGCGYQREALGPCVGGECPDGYMCICDYCCEGCRDDCYDCALFQQYCNNTNYCELRQKCKKTCEICQDATTTTDNEWREFKVVLILRSDDGQEIISDPLEKINRTFSDLKFNQTFIFNNLSPEFSIEAILYAQRSDENAVPTIVQSVSRSLGRRFGLSLKRYMGSSNTINSKFFVEEEEEEIKDPQDETRMFRELTPIGRTVFRLQNASLSGRIRVYQLQTEWPELINRRVPKSVLLPIFGNICCQIFVQPNSLVQPLAQGPLDLYFIDDRLLLQQLSCVLQGGFLKCYNPNSNTAMSNSSPINIPIDENTEVDLTGFQTALKITLHDSKGDFQKRLMIIASSQSSFLGWKEAIKLQILDCQTWKEFASLNHNTFSLKSMGGLNLSLRNSISRYAQQFGTLPVIASDTRKFLQEQGFDLPIYRRSRRPLSTVFPKQNNAKETTPDESQLNHMTKKRRPESDVLPNTYVINLKIGLSDDDDVDEIDNETLRKISSSAKPIPIVVSETESKSSLSSRSSSVSSSSTKVTTSRTNLSSSLVNKIKQNEINRELSSTLPKVIRTKVPPPIPPKPSIVRNPPPPSSSSRSYKPPVPPRKLPPSQSFTQPIRMYNYTSDITTVTRL